MTIGSNRVVEGLLEESKKVEEWGEWKGLRGIRFSLKSKTWPQEGEAETACWAIFKAENYKVLGGWGVRVLKMWLEFR